jgi:hypothetical protein
MTRSVRPISPRALAEATGDYAAIAVLAPVQPPQPRVDYFAYPTRDLLRRLGL